MRLVLLLMVVGCHGLRLSPQPMTLTYSSGWHDCGDGWGCPEWWACAPRRTCEYVGDINGPGPADTDQSGSDPSQPQ